MSYLNFDKSELVNLEYSLKRETIRSNRAGTYASSTVIGCNTRKYHGLFVTPMEHLDNDRHVLLSTLDCTLIEGGRTFDLGIHKYEGQIYFPPGHKYIQDFSTETIPRLVYRIGSVRISRELVLVEKEQQLLIRYTILESDGPIELHFKPFLAFRNLHQLSRANMHANTKVKPVSNGVKIRLYDGYPYLHMQFSCSNEFVSIPDWYYNIEYTEEQKRGYDYKEDLLVPGYFECRAKKGDVIIFSAATTEGSPSGFKRKFAAELSKKVPRTSFKNCLINSAEQFFVHHDRKTEVIAGFHWFGTWGRDTFIALPGLTLTRDDQKTFMEVVNTMVQKLQNGLFPNMGSDDNPSFNTVDASMWFFWAMQQYSYKYRHFSPIWKKYKKYFIGILESYRNGTLHNIHMLDNGLIYAGETGKALTWMDAVVYGKAITPRIGCPVEINALWYNAICYCIELAEKANDDAFVDEWKPIAEKVGVSFVESFWDDHKAYLADYVTPEGKNWDVRPNQIIAAALHYSPLETRMKKAIVDVVKRDLLTTRGLRTLAPNHPNYVGVYEGSQEQRDAAYHQGTVWPWLMEHFAEAYVLLYKKEALPLLEKIINDFDATMMEHGIGSVSEIYDGNPPHKARGAISQAWSVSALLSILEKTEKLRSSQ